MSNVKNKDGAWYLQADEAERGVFREWVTDALRTDGIVVEFVKTDGTLRKMSATLDPLVVPPTPEPKVLAEGEVARVKKANTEVCSVWDIEAKGWRSFRFDKVNSIQLSV